VIVFLSCNIKICLIEKNIGILGILTGWCSMNLTKCSIGFMGVLLMNCKRLLTFFCFFDLIYLKILRLLNSWYGLGGVL